MIGRRGEEGREKERVREEAAEKGKNRLRRGAWRRWQMFRRCKYLCPPQMTAGSLITALAKTAFFFHEG